MVGQRVPARFPCEDGSSAIESSGRRSERWRRFQIDAGFCNRRCSASVRALFDSWEYSLAISSASLPSSRIPRSTRELQHAPRRVGDQIIIALNQNVGLCHPEPVIGENLMDHALAEQLLERHSPFMHQRKDDVAHVTMGVNRHGSTSASAAARTWSPSCDFDDAPLRGCQRRLVPRRGSEWMSAAYC